MDVKLIVQSGTRRNKAITLRSAETIIGRRQDCDLRIPSADVSRRHCLLSVHDGYLAVEDLDSVNGTFVNGVRVTGKQVVRPGDRLEVGPLAFRVDYVLSAGAAQRLKDEGQDVEEVEVLPLSEEPEMEAVVLEDDADSGRAFRFDDEPETELIPPDSGQQRQEDEVIPLVEDVEEAELDLSGGDLRELFEPKPPKKPRRPGKS
jgi:pSer/pThr/pTyr-binding forkhead associated (FHA) protein